MKVCERIFTFFFCSYAKSSKSFIFWCSYHLVGLQSSWTFAIKIIWVMQFSRIFSVIVLFQCVNHTISDFYHENVIQDWKLKGKFKYQIFSWNEKTFLNFTKYFSFSLTLRLSSSAQFSRNFQNVKLRHHGVEIYNLHAIQNLREIKFGEF